MGRNHSAASDRLPIPDPAQESVARQLARATDAHARSGWSMFSVCVASPTLRTVYAAVVQLRRGACHCLARREMANPGGFRLHSLVRIAGPAVDAAGRLPGTAKPGMGI